MMFRLKQLLDSSKPVLSAWCGITDPHYLERVCEFSFDAVVLDMQHGFFDETSVQAGIATLISKGKAPIVRIPLGRWDTASRVLDFGALGVIAPMINSVEDARKLASVTKFVPVGERSFGPRHAASLYGVSSNEYLEEFDHCSLVLAMIETLEAYHKIEGILKVEGIDGVLIGPGDLSISVRQDRIPDPYGTDTIDMVKDIINRCKIDGKKAAAFTIDSNTANRLSEMGADLISVGIDDTYIANGIASHISGLKFR
ncbi:MAG: aldolase/citrate lyase family protein [Gammaproteobacteria bacterium]|nr:aldolase/citrate lyase family protein [Gammaproteobacteria bacterium]